jgi:hypothetical protein
MIRWVPKSMLGASASEAMLPLPDWLTEAVLPEAAVNRSCAEPLFRQL